MRQFVLPDTYNGEPEAELTGKDAHYLVRVLRLRPEDSFPALDTQGNHYHCTLLTLGNTPSGGDTVKVRVQRKGAPSVERPDITIVQSLPKGRKLEDVIRRCTEAGISRLQPVFTDYTVVKLDPAKVESKLERWQRIAREAVQQSGSPAPVHIGRPQMLEEYLATRQEFADEGAIRLVLHQQPLEQASLHRYLSNHISEIEMVIGPEGGLSDRELTLLRSSGYKPVYLGPQVLRTETVALYATAAVQTIVLEKSDWSLTSSFPA
ncbi:MAG: RsmE family RNA methyltransferase [Spirochaetota bacterium]